MFLGVYYSGSYIIIAWVATTLWCTVLHAVLNHSDLGWSVIRLAGSLQAEGVSAAMPCPAWCIAAGPPVGLICPWVPALLTTSCSGGCMSKRKGNLCDCYPLVKIDNHNKNSQLLILTTWPQHDLPLTLDMTLHLPWPRRVNQRSFCISLVPISDNIKSEWSPTQQRTTCPVTRDFSYIPDNPVCEIIQIM